MFKVDKLVYNDTSRLTVCDKGFELLTAAMSWQLAIQIVKRYFPQIMLPITITVGFIGYSIENYLRPQVKPPTSSKSTSEAREERRLREMQSSTTQDR